MSNEFQMVELSTMIQILQNLMSPDNNIRIKTELDFKHLLEANTNNFSSMLIQIALNDTVDLSIRQASLLHMKRIVPMFWSPAFDKFIGPIPINQTVKSNIRKSLLTLLGDPDSKIRSSSGYAIVQIAAVDYPDEWPDLLNILYDAASNPNSTVFEIIGSLAVIQEVFDDVVTEKQFFEGGVSIQVLKTCENLLENGNNPISVKIETLRLLRVVSQCFDTIDTSDPQKQQLCTQIIPGIIKFLVRIETQQKVGDVYQLLFWEFKFELYMVLVCLIRIFPDYINDNADDFFSLVNNSLSLEKDIYTQLLRISPTNEILASTFSDLNLFYSLQKERKEPMTVFTKTIAKQIELLHVIIEYQNIGDPDKIFKIINLLIPLCLLSVSKIDDYNSDFNQFVTDESGLSSETSIRESARDLLGEMNETDNTACIHLLVNMLESIDDIGFNKLHVEAITYLLSCCFDTDDTLVALPDFKADEFLKNVINIIKSDNFLDEEFQFLISRFILMIPKFIFKYVDYCKQFAISSLNEIMSIIPKLGNNDEFLIIKASILFATQYYNYSIRAKEFGNDIQFQLLDLVNQLKDDADEDTNMMLLEVLSVIISIDNLALVENSDTINLILTIGFKDQPNFSMSTSLFECIEDLIKDITEEKYLELLKSTFPYLLGNIASYDGKFNFHIDLSLEILTAILNNENYQLSKSIFHSTFSIITRFLLICDDDSLLQSGSEALVRLLKISVTLCSSYIDEETHETGTQILLKSLSKFLSPNLTDKAIVNLGDLVMVVLNNFSDSVHEYLNDILKALTIRLIKAVEVPTIENIILIFNSLAISQPKETIQFLKSFTVDNKTALHAILPIWFEAYEVMRGYNSIISNVCAFIEIFKLNDETIQQFLVNGEAIPHQFPEGLIVTRSIARNTPIKYEQIPADAKIIKLLIEELKNEMATAVKEIPSVIHAHSHSNEDDNDDDWEDFEEIETSFDHLKTYVDENGNPTRASDGNSDDMKQTLISFFKDCTSDNFQRFEIIYKQYLSETEKSLLSEYLAFH